MTPQQIVGVILLLSAVGLVVWSVWPSFKSKPKPSPQPQDDESCIHDSVIVDWADIHRRIAELQVLLFNNAEARKKLNELGASLYNDANWGIDQDDLSS
jgi:hypothetical protein